MIDLRSEEDLRRYHGILVWQEQLSAEKSAFIWSFIWSLNLYVKVSKVMFIWRRIDTNDWICGESFSFLYKC